MSFSSPVKQNLEKAKKTVIFQISPSLWLMSNDITIRFDQIDVFVDGGSDTEGWIWGFGWVHAVNTWTVPTILPLRSCVKKFWNPYVSILKWLRRCENHHLEAFQFFPPRIHKLLHVPTADFGLCNGCREDILVQTNASQRKSSFSSCSSLSLASRGMAAVVEDFLKNEEKRGNPKIQKKMFEPALWIWK